MEKSESINELAAALSKAQGEMKSAEKDAANPFFKSSYSTLASVIYASKEALAKNGLCVIQAPQITEDGRNILETMLAHSSGQWVRSIYPLNPIKNDPQGLGSCLSYAKRYVLQAMLCIPSSDDDSESAMGRDIKKPQTPQLDTLPAAKKAPSSASVGHISEAQLARLFAIASKYGWPKTEIDEWVKKLGLSSSKELNQLQYNKLCETIQAYPKNA